MLTCVSSLQTRPPLAEAFFLAAGTEQPTACSWVKVSWISSWTKLLGQKRRRICARRSRMGDEQRDVVLYLAFLGLALGLSVIVMGAMQVVGRLPAFA